MLEFCISINKAGLVEMVKSLQPNKLRFELSLKELFIFSIERQ